MAGFRQGDRACRATDEGQACHPVRLLVRGQRHRRPQLELRASLKPDDVVVAVGDVVSFTLKQLGVTPWLFVCDYQTQRGKPEPLFELELGSWGRLAFRVRNPAAQVTRQAWDAIRLGLEH